MIAVNPAYEQTADDLLVGFLESCKAEPLRSITQFALDEIVLPDDGGPFGGEAFDLERQPYVKLLYAEIENGEWSEIYITGPSQSGKTLCAFVIIVAYIAAELRKNLIIGVPIGEMVNDKWEVDIKPVFAASPSLSKLLPVKGPGSSNGKVKDSVQLTNGVTLKFMTRGGSDVSKAAFTSPKVVVTEAAAWSQAVSTSKEADPLAQLRGRQRSKSRFTDDGDIDSERQMIVEGTLTDEDDLPFRMRKHSTKSRIVSKCVHCKDYVAPEREHLGGYEEATNELDAAKSGCFFCPACGESINESQRRKMVHSSKLIHEGQSINKRGKVTGAPPKTSVLWFRWSAFHNLFLKIADLAADEWKSKQIEEDTPERDDAERELCQQVWAIPYKLRLIAAAPLDRTAVARRMERFTLGTVPPNNHYLAFGVDVGRWTCYYYGLSLRHDGTLHTPFYGSQDTSLSRDMDEDTIKQHEDNAIKECLHQIFDLIEAGWPMPGGNLVSGDLTYVDTRYCTTAVFEAVKERGGGVPGAKLFGIQGVGKTQLNSRRYIAPRKRGGVIRKIGHHYHIEYSTTHRQQFVVIDVDHSKSQIQRCLRVSPGMPGALTLPLAPERVHRTVARQLSSEWYRRWKEPDGSVKEKFVVSGANHWLDCAGYGFTAGAELGWRIPNTKPPTPQNNLGLPEWLNA